jgi:ABC-type cobalamin transport system ATPase subunit
MVDGREGGEMQRTRREARLLQQIEHQVLDAARILPAQERGEIFEQRQQRPVGAVVVAFAPAGDAFVGIDGHDDPRAVLVARHIRAQLRDLHGAAYFSWNAESSAL